MGVAGRSRPSRYICLVLGLPQVSEGLGLYFEDSASSEEEEFVGMVHEVSPIPHSGREEEGGEV